MSALSVFLKGAAKKLVEDGAELAVKKDAKTAAREGAELAVKRAERKALPAPAKRLALPAPNPKDITAKRVSESKYKPKGGQWLAPAKMEHADASPETAVRRFRKENVWEPDEGLQTALSDEPTTPLSQWLEKALTRYVKRDMGTEDDPVAGLIERGLGPQNVRDRDAWYNLVNDYIGVDSAGDHLGLDKLFGMSPAEVAKTRATLSNVMGDMPWLNKLPSTEPVYGIYGNNAGLFDQMGFGHVVDEMGNALDGGSGIPSHLQIDPASLNRMSWPQAVERAGAIDQWRAAKMAEEQSNIVANNPAFVVHKTYGEDNPLGLAWYQIRQPEYDENVVPDGWQQIEGGLWRNSNATGAAGDPKYSDDHPAMRTALQQLQAALTNEGDVMGHCVGGYCDDVARGDSAIYSLRDAKGEPHVTIETTPRRDSYSGFGNDLNAIQPGVWDQIVNHPNFGYLGGYQTVEENFPDLWEKYNTPSIVQIKGKQNRKPNPEYIPFVQDFIRSGNWGDVGELRNADMFRLPDRRFIAQHQLDEIVRKPETISLMGSEDNARKNLAGWNLHTFSPEDWEQTKHLFEGYRNGGLVVKRGCSCGCGTCGDRKAV